MTGHAGTRVQSAPSDQTPQHRRGRFNVYAAFDEQSQAQHAVEALGRAGYEGANISLKGPSDVTTPGETAAADARILTRWFGTVAAWAAAGAVAGFVVGAVLGAFIIESVVDRDANAGNVTAAGLLGALFGSTIAGLAAMVWPMQGGDAWEQTFHAEHGERIVVGVHVDDRDGAERALKLLDADEPVDTYVSGARDRSIERRHEMAQ